jgi:multiple RNA-binding domain-containing protein 1
VLPAEQKPAEPEETETWW